MINLHVEPRTFPMSWREFGSRSPVRSIALDGYVRMGPRYNPTGPRANFNHHEEVSRLETRATCAQVLLAVRMGLFDSFQDEKGAAAADLFVNDCDEDVSLAVFILQHHPLAVGTMNPLLNRLVAMEDLLDTTAGAYPFPKDLETLQRLMWVFAPYHHFRVSGELDKREEDAFSEVIADVGRRIMAYITGESEVAELDTRHEVVGSGTGWSMVKEVGPNARIGVYDGGIRAFISARETPQGRHVYTLGRSSIFVPFPIPKLLKALNIAEGNKKDLWGGSDIIAGSPRVSGSKLDPDLVTLVVEECLDAG